MLPVMNVLVAEGVASEVLTSLIHVLMMHYPHARVTQQVGMVLPRGKLVVVTVKSSELNTKEIKHVILVNTPLYQNQVNVIRRS